jgi:putative IMPACT (imprinted ancient) family translation regulator
LGVGGLIQAYRSAAKMSLELSEIIELEVLTKYSLNFSYARLNTVMAVLKKRQIQITYQLLDLDCEITIAANQPNAIGLENAFKKFKDIKLKKIND